MYFNEQAYILARKLDNNESLYIDKVVVYSSNTFVIVESTTDQERCREIILEELKRNDLMLNHIMSRATIEPIPLPITDFDELHKMVDCVYSCGYPIPMKFINMDLNPDTNITKVGSLVTESELLEVLGDDELKYELISPEKELLSRYVTVSLNGEEFDITSLPWYTPTKLKLPK